MGKRYDKKMLMIENGEYMQINSITPVELDSFLQDNPFPEIKGNNIYTLESIMLDIHATNVWCIPNDTPEEVKNWIENLFESIGTYVDITLCNVIYESICWELLDWVEC